MVESDAAMDITAVFHPLLRVALRFASLPLPLHEQPFIELRRSFAARCIGMEEQRSPAQQYPCALVDAHHCGLSL